MWRKWLENFKWNLKHRRKKRRDANLKYRVVIVVLIIFILTMGWMAVTHAMPFQILYHAIRDMISGSTQDVTVTAVPHANILPPIDLTITYINDSDLQVTWINDILTADTMIVVNYNHYPTLRTDGYVLYDALGILVDDLSVNLNEYWGTYYVSAWSRDGAGNWSATYTSARYEVDMTALVAGLQQWLVFAIVIAIIALAFWRGTGFLRIMAGLVAVAFGAYWISQQVGFIYVIEGTVAVAIGIYLLISTAVDLIRG